MEDSPQRRTSASRDRSALGSNWRHNWDVRLRVYDEQTIPPWLSPWCAGLPGLPTAVGVHWGDSSSELFLLDIGTRLYLPQAGSVATLAKAVDGWMMRFPDGRLLEFDTLGCLVADTDRFGNRFTIAWEPTPLGLLFDHFCSADELAVRNETLAARRNALLAWLCGAGRRPGADLCRRRSGQRYRPVRHRPAQPGEAGDAQARHERRATGQAQAQADAPAPGAADAHRPRAKQAARATRATGSQTANATGPTAAPARGGATPLVRKAGPHAGLTPEARKAWEEIEWGDWWAATVELPAVEVLSRTVRWAAIGDPTGIIEWRLDKADEDLGIDTGGSETERTLRAILGIAGPHIGGLAVVAAKVAQAKKVLTVEISLTKLAKVTSLEASVSKALILEKYEGANRLIKDGLLEAVIGEKIPYDKRLSRTYVQAFEGLEGTALSNVRVPKGWNVDEYLSRHLGGPRCCSTSTCCWPN